MFGTQGDVRVSDEDVDEVIKFARPKHSDIVACIGRNGARIAVEFAGRGGCAAAYFENSGRQRRNRLADLLVVGAMTPGDEIGTLLCSNMQILKPGGRLIFRLQDMDDDCIVQLCLSALGYSVMSTVFDMSIGTLVAHQIALGRLGLADDRADGACDEGGQGSSRKPTLSFGKLYYSSAIAGSTPAPAPFIQSCWS